MLFNFVTTAGGSISFGTIPNDPFFVGLTLQFQSDIYQDAIPHLRELSNRVAGQIGVPNAPMTLTNQSNIGRSAASHIRRVNPITGNIEHIVAGGATALPTTPHATSERFDTRTLEWTGGPSLNVARFGAETVELLDGRVLVIGGIDAASNGIAQCEVYDPATDQFALVQSMSRARALHTAVRLLNGEVLVVSGSTTLVGLTTIPGVLTSTTTTTEIFSPVTNTWRPGPPTPTATVLPAMTMLQDGRVLFSGGVRATIFPPSIAAGTECYLLNAAATTWTPTGSMSVGRAQHQSQTLRLFDGTVLAVGGMQVNAATVSINAIPDWETYNPATGSWAYGGQIPGSPVSSGTVAIMPDPTEVLFVGGMTGTGPIASVFLPPVTDIHLFRLTQPTRWQTPPPAPLSAPRGLHGLFRTEPDGMMMVVGGMTTSLQGARSIDVIPY
ncbi:MAG: hypothetical protein ABL997_09335 [Planctomycetota bacterium]